MKILVFFITYLKKLKSKIKSVKKQNGVNRASFSAQREAVNLIFEGEYPA